MAKEICSNCNVKMTRPVAFCPGCSRPTEHATPSELLEWDLGQWRRHVDQAVASGQAKPASVPLRSVVAVAEPVSPVLPPAPSALRVERSPEPPGQLDTPKVKRPKRHLPEPEERDRVIVLDADSAFVYTSCTSCERADWIIRTTRNEDDTYNYWCVRCSRSFKTDARLRSGLKPFLSSGLVIGALATLSIVMR
ncbi:MAG: hypothetical protein WEB06_02160 [Actinomycetota bacterium]